MSQVSKVLAYMESHDYITTMDAFEHLRITRLPARISDIIDRGYRISKETVRDGKSWYVRYRLVKENEDD